MNIRPAIASFSGPKHISLGTNPGGVLGGVFGNRWLARCSLSKTTPIVEYHIPSGCKCMDNCHALQVKPYTPQCSEWGFTSNVAADVLTGVIQLERDHHTPQGLNGVSYPKWLQMHGQLSCTSSEAIYTAMLRVEFYI